MKITIIAGGLLLAISLMSFTSKVDDVEGVVRLGETFYHVVNDEVIADDDKQVILTYVQESYGLEDWSSYGESVDLQMKNDDGKEKKCANSVFSTKVFMQAIDEKLVRYDCAAATAEPMEAEVIGILDQYAR